MFLPNLSGVRCILRMGKTSPTPLSADVISLLQKIEIHHDDMERSGFQIAFSAIRNKSPRNSDYAILKNPQLALFNRIEILVSINAHQHILMDGIITHTEVNPDEGVITITGEDIGFALDREEKNIAHPMQNDKEIVSNIIAHYSQYNLVAKVIAPPVATKPGKLENPALQRNMTDWDYLTTLAKRHGYVFYIATNTKLKKNLAYWGPPVRGLDSQGKLSVNLGPYSNTSGVRIYHDPQRAKTFSGMVQDEKTNKVMPLIKTTDSTIKNLARSNNSDNYYSTKSKLNNTSGLTYQEANALAQAKTNATASNTVKVTGQVDVTRYGKVLQARDLVDLCGVGHTHDGQYYVKQVVHEITPGNYQQNFTLIREGANK